MIPAMTTTTPMYISNCRRLSTAPISSVGKPCCRVALHPVTQNATGLATAMSTPAMMHPTRTFCALACSSGPSDLTRGRARWIIKADVINKIRGGNASEQRKLARGKTNVSTNFLALLCLFLIRNSRWCR